MRKRIFASIVLFAALMAQAPEVFAQFAWLRNPVRDVERRVERKLNEEEIQIVEYIVTLYATKYDKSVDGESYGKAVRSMTKEQYGHTIEKAVEAVNSKTVKILFKAGKLGENGIKTLFLILEDTAEDIDKFFEEKAAEYDRTH